jgi:hypothetical protein
MMGGTERARAAAAAALVAVLLGGCGVLVGGGGDRGEPEWVHDADSKRYYRPGLVVQSTELVEEHFPVLGTPGSVTVAEGRFTDPYERAPIPAPDDYWWQAVIELELSQVERLRGATADSGTSDIGGAEAPEPVADEQVLAELVPSLEGELQDCAGGWVDVTPALTEPGYADRSAAGDGIELAVVCEGGTQLLTSAHDM